jgi:bifunctional non-homologous end joining protein LigD
MMKTAVAPTDTLILTNLTKVFWPECGLTKRDLIDYYREIATVILPYLMDRPQVLHRHVDGHAGKEFFQRMSRHCPPWMKFARITLDGGKRVRDVHVCQDWPTLLWMANFGCIELIPWGSRVGSLDSPDYMVIDLDPQDVPLPKTVQVALTVRGILDKIGAESVCKTSGKRGLHVYVPFGKKYTFGQAKMLAELVAILANRALPETTSLDPRPDRRRNRIYLDTTRNARGQAVAAAYSARPHPGATVSAPLKWSEVGKKLDPTKYTIKTMPGRVEKVGDLWRAVLGPGIDLRACLQRLEKLCR